MIFIYRELQKTIEIFKILFIKGQVFCFTIDIVLKKKFTRKR